MAASGQSLTLPWIWAVDFQLLGEMTPPWESELPLTPHYHFVPVDEQLKHAYSEPCGQAQTGRFEDEI